MLQNLGLICKRVFAKRQDFVSVKIKKIRNCKNFRRFRSNFRIAKVFENSEIFIWKFQMKMIENFIWKFQMKSEFSYENFEWNVDSLQFFLSGYNGCILLVRMKLWVFSYTLTTNCPPKTTQEDDILDKKTLFLTTSHDLKCIYLYETERIC